MELLPAKDIAQQLGVDVAMIRYWHSRGRLDRYQPDMTKKRFYFDIEQVRSVQGRTMYDGLPDNLVTRKEAARYLWVTDAEIGYYTRRGYLTKHYVLGNNFNYMLDEAEVRAVNDKIAASEVRRIQRLRELGDSYSIRDQHGRFLPKKKRA